MRMYRWLLIHALAGCALAQPEGGNVAPQITTVVIGEGTVTMLHLSAGYSTAVRLPEAVNSVVLGDPAKFKAEYSEAEPRLVFLKPTTTQPAESNALITTKTGQEISLHLINAGQAAGNSNVDFLVELRRPGAAPFSAPAAQSLLIPGSRPLAQEAAATGPHRAEDRDTVGRELEKQKAVSVPAWQGKELLAAVGESIEQRERTLLRFSVLNHSGRVAELLPPQIEFSASAGKHQRKKQIKAEPVAVTDYRMTARRLGPGERADGVVVFQRPAFKESGEKLLLQLAEAGRIDRPILLPVPFTASRSGGEQ